jgi:anthranilate 1,2-dioxygenase small subunit
VSALPVEPRTVQPVAADVRDAVEDLLTGYTHVLDDGRVDEWASLFEKDAIYQVTTRENVEAGRPVGIVLCIGRPMMEDRIKALKLANIFESHVFRHVVGRPLIEPAGSDRYRVRSSFVIYRTMFTGRTDVFATGRYDDLITGPGDGFRFAERIAVLDSRVIDTLMVYPI